MYYYSKFIVVSLILLVGSVIFAEELKLPNSLKDVKVGEWLLYELVVPGAKMQQKQTVVKVDKNKITIKYDTIMNGKVVSSTNQVIDRSQKGQTLQNQKNKAKISKGNATVKDKKIDCYIAETTTNVGGKESVVVSYMSEDIPITGVVKVEMNGNPKLKLVDFGAK